MNAPYTSGNEKENKMPYPYGFQQPYFGQPAQDQLAQLRQPYQMPTMSAQPAPSIIWVQGYQEAQNYLVAPNSAVVLWDSNSPVVYLKQTDASGKPSLKIYDLIERTAPLQNAQQAISSSDSDFVTRKEFEVLVARLDALSEKKPSKSTEEEK